MPYHENQKEQAETVTIVGVKQKRFDDGGVKWMLHDDQNRWFQFYETNRSGQESGQFREWKGWVEQAVAEKQTVTIRFTVEEKTGASGDTYTLYKVSGFEAAE
jgi:hypothetical protein